MCKLAVVLTCLACTSQGRRVRNPIEQTLDRESATSWRLLKAFDAPSRSQSVAEKLVLLFGVYNCAATFRPPGPELNPIAGTSAPVRLQRGLNTWSRLDRRISLARMLGEPSDLPVEEPLPPLLLASKSATRQLILKEMGFKFTCMPADIDEKAIGDRLRDRPEELVLEIGRAKASKILDTLQKSSSEVVPGTLLLAGDQVVVYNGSIREKPADSVEAEAFIRSYALLPCSTVGSCVVVDMATGQFFEGVDRTTVHFSAIPDDIIARLVAEGEVLYCAGGLMIEHPLVQPYIDRVDGSIDSVMGLSKALVKRLVGQAIAQRGL